MTDTNYTPDTRQLRIHRSKNEQVRRLALANGESMAALYARLALAASTQPVEDDDLVRQRVEIEPEPWAKLQALAKAQRVTVAELVERVVDEANRGVPA
jgi:hypothetical protein